MGYVQQYVELDGEFHALTEDPNHAACGVEVPYGSPYAPLGDDQKAHCGPDAKPKKAKASEAAPIKVK